MRQQPNLDHVKDYTAKAKIGYMRGQKLEIIYPNTIILEDTVSKYFSRYDILKLIEEDKIVGIEKEEVQEVEKEEVQEVEDQCNFGLELLEFPKSYDEYIQKEVKENAKKSNILSKKEVKKPVKRKRKKSSNKGDKKMLKGDNKKMDNKNTKSKENDS